MTLLVATRPNLNLRVKEADGTPDVPGVSVVVVSNGTLTNDGGGQVTLNTGGTTLPVVDETALVFKTGSPAITATFDANALTQARVYGLPDTSTTLAGLAAANVFAAANTFSDSVDIGDTAPTFADVSLSIRDNITAAGNVFIQTVEGTFVSGGSGDAYGQWWNPTLRCPNGRSAVLFYVGGSVGASSGSATTYGVRVVAPSLSNVGSHFQLRIENPSGASGNNWGIVSVAAYNHIGGKLMVGYGGDNFSTASYPAAFGSYLNVRNFSATNNAIVNVADFEAAVDPGAATHGHGAAINLLLETTTSPRQSAARFVTLWNVATHASAVADVVLQAYYNNSGTFTASEICRGRAGANPGFAVLGADPVPRAAHIADPAGGGTQDAEARTAINAILVELENRGFVATS